MRVILNQQEIETAIENYVLENVTVPDDHRIDIDLKATRGDEGYTAEIDLLHHAEPEGSRAVDDRIAPKPEAIAEGLGIVDKIEAAKADANTPRRRGRPAGSKNKTPLADAAGVPTPPTETVIAEHPAHEPNEETQAAMTDAREGNVETAATPAELIEKLDEPETPAEVEQVEEVQAVVEDAQPEATIEPTPEPVAEVTEAGIPAEEAAPVPAATQTRPSLFAKASPTPTDDPVEQPAPAANAEPETEVDEPVEPEPEANSEEALAAEAAATEPAPAPRKSLFSDLTKPK